MDRIYKEVHRWINFKWADDPEPAGPKAMPKRNQGKRRAPREVSEPKETPKRKQGEIRVAIKTKTPPTKISTGEQKRRRPDGSDGGAHHEASREEYPGDDAANGKSKRMRSRSPEVLLKTQNPLGLLGSSRYNSFSWRRRRAWL